MHTHTKNSAIHTSPDFGTETLVPMYAQQEAFYQLLRDTSMDLWATDDYDDDTVWTTISARFILPATWTEDILATTNQPLVTSEDIYHLPVDSSNLGLFRFHLDNTMATLEDACDTLHTYDVVTQQGRTAAHCERFSDLLEGKQQIQKINSSVLEPGAQYLRQNMTSTIIDHRRNILGQQARNLTFVVSPALFDTQAHNDETDSIVHSFGCNTSVKLWMFVPNGTTHEVDLLNRLLFSEPTDSLLEILTALPTLRLVLQLPGWSVFNPFHSSHAVLTRGQDGTGPFLGVAQQSMTRERLSGWPSYLVHRIVAGTFDHDEVMDMIQQCAPSR